MLKGKVVEAHPVFYVRDLKASLAFYHGKLGFEISFEIPEAKLAEVIVNDGASIVFCENAEKIRSKGAPVLVFNIDDVDAAYAALKERGVAFEGEPADEFYGRAVDLHDPDGYPLCLVSQPVE